MISLRLLLADRYKEKVLYRTHVRLQHLVRAEVWEETTEAQTGVSIPTVADALTVAGTSVEEDNKITY